MQTGLETRKQGAQRLEEYWQLGPCFTVRHWTVTQATVSLSLAESEAKAITKGCLEALYVKHLLEHQTARTFQIEVWTDSSSAKAIIQRLGPAQSEALGGAGDVGSTVEQARPHLTEQAGYAGERGRPTDKTRATSSSGQVGRNDGLLIPWCINCKVSGVLEHSSE